MIVNLNRFLWTADKGVWEQHAPGDLDTIWRAFAGQRWPLTIQTICQPVARRGLVIVAEGQARGEFRCLWDKPAVLASNLDLVDEKGAFTVAETEFLTQLPHLEGEAIGVSQRFSLTASTFEELLAGIEAEEGKLLQNNWDTWQALKRRYRTPTSTL